MLLIGNCFLDAARFIASPAIPRARDATARLFLDLGKVAVMAQVKLNGRELGTRGGPRRGAWI